MGENNLQKKFVELYLIIGIAFSIMLSLADYDRDEIHFVFLFIAVIPSLGIRYIGKCIFDFIKKYWFLAGSIIIWMAYFSVNTSQLYFRANRFPLAALILVFLGAIIGGRDIDEQIKTINSALMLLIVLETVGVINYVLSYSPGLRMSFAYSNAILEGDAIIFMLLLGLLFSMELRIKVISIVVAVIAAICTGNRATLIELVLIMIAFMIISRKDICEVFTADRKRTRIIFVVSILGIGLVCFVLWSRVMAILFAVAQRIAITANFDTSSAYRLFAARTYLQFVPDGSFLEIILGRGCMQGYYRLIEYTESSNITFGTQIGPVENTFLSLMYDYGILAFVLYAGVFVHAIVNVIGAKDIHVRKLAVLVVGVMFTSAFVDMEYWPNMCFVLFTTIGIYLGGIAKWDKEN